MRWLTSGSSWTSTRLLVDWLSTGRDADELGLPEALSEWRVCMCMVRSDSTLNSAPQTTQTSGGELFGGMVEGDEADEAATEDTSKRLREDNRR